ncbi:MAG: Sua5/YciO/YrdC/YwlC family protein, partial [Mariprofundaceae bacterium]
MARLLRDGGLIAHATGTVAGVAAIPAPDAIRRLQRFKQRRGPFLMLADSMRTALALARRRPAALRRLMRQDWPGPVTLVYAARPPAGRATTLCPHGRAAVRVDADA